MAKKATKAGLIGAIAGAIAGVFLFAPKGARQNRADLKKAAGKAQTAAEKRLKSVYSDLQKQLNRVKAQAGKLQGKAAKEAGDLEAKLEALLAQTKHLITTAREGDEEISGQISQVVGEAGKLKKLVVKKVKGATREAARKVRSAKR